VTARLITVDAHDTWRFAPEDAPPLADRIQALLQAIVTDEITGLPPDAAITVTTEITGLTARTAGGGRVGLVGRPLALYAPGFVAGAPLSMSLAAPGFQPLALSAALPAQPGYPDAFTPRDLGVVTMHRAPTSISGRTVSHTHIVRPGSAVEIDGVWLTQADLTGAAGPATIISIASALYADRPAGGSVRQFNVTPAPPGEAKQLVGPAVAGATQIRLSDQTNLAVGDLLLIDPPDQGRAEIIAVTAIVDPGSGPDLPATAVLAFALQRYHAKGTTVVRAVPAAPGAPNALARAGQIGDVTLFPATMSGLDATMTAVEVTGGSAAAEYHWAAVYSVTSDPDGYYRLPPVHRIAQIQLHTDNAAEPTPLTLPVTLDWGRSELVLDLVFP
jgi:hypothetical protein